MTDLSIIIPAREEMFLQRTVDDILRNIRADTEIIVILDGRWSDPPIEDNEHVTLIYHSESVGQREAANEAARIAKGKYIAKLDAHVAIDEGMDAKMLSVIQWDWTMAPTMRNLHAFDWVCKKCGNRTYQGPTPTSCPNCDNKKDFERDVVWIAKRSPQSNSFCFDSTPHFQYFNDFCKRPEGKGNLTESMSLQGSFFMLSKEKYFELNICDENFGSWGSQGIEVACKTWLSGGKVMIYHDTWYAHMFRTQGGDFGFPYSLSGRQVEHAKKTAKELFFQNKWSKQTRPLSWLVKRFWPVPGWTDEDLASIDAEEVKEYAKEVKEYAEPKAAENAGPSKGIVYYTDNILDKSIMSACQTQLEMSAAGLDLVSVSLSPIKFGRNIVLNLERGYLTMFKQILTGLEASNADIIFFCEHDVLYHESHFEFTPPEKNIFYYNRNNWKVRYDDGQALFYYCEQTLGLCAYRELLLEHYRKRVERVAKEGFDRHMGFEPGKHSYPRGVDSYGWSYWNSRVPNIDIRHDKNLTKNRWSQDQFRDKRNCQGWVMSDEIPGWGVTKNRFKPMIEGTVAERNR